MIKKMVISILTILMVVNPAISGDDIFVRNGVKCRRVLTPTNYGSFKESFVPIEEPKVIERIVEKPVYERDPNDPRKYTEEDLLKYSEEEYQNVILGILKKAQRDQARREDIKLLRTLGLKFAEDSEDRYGYVDQSLYSRGNYVPESNYGISVRESIDYVGSDPTDVIAASVARNIDGIRGLHEDVSNRQALALEELVRSRSRNSESYNRALQIQAEAQADALKIKTIGEILQRAKVDRDINLSGIFSSLGETPVEQSPVIADSDPVVGSDIQSLVNSKCAKCHDSSLPNYNQARLDLRDMSKISDSELLSVMRKVRAGEMPPNPEEPLTKSEQKVFVDHFINELE